MSERSSRSHAPARKPCSIVSKAARETATARGRPPQCQGYALRHHPLYGGASRRRNGFRCHDGRQGNRAPPFQRRQAGRRIPGIGPPQRRRHALWHDRKWGRNLRQPSEGIRHSSRSRHPARKPYYITSRADGAAPWATLIDVNGTLYGTTVSGWYRQWFGVR